MQPTNAEEFNARFFANQRIEGFGPDTTTHVPCFFCAAPNFMSWTIADPYTPMGAGAVCSECGRGAKMVFTPHDEGVSFEVVQTVGDDAPDWLPGPPMRRV